MVSLPARAFTVETLPVKAPVMKRMSSALRSPWSPDRGGNQDCHGDRRFRKRKTKQNVGNSAPWVNGLWSASDQPHAPIAPGRPWSTVGAFGLNRVHWVFPFLQGCLYGHGYALNPVVDEGHIGTCSLAQLTYWDNVTTTIGQLQDRASSRLQLAMNGWVR